MAVWKWNACVALKSHSIVFENNVPAILNPTLNQTDSVNKSKHEIRMYLLKNTPFKSLSCFIATRFMGLVPRFSASVNNETGGLLSKFTRSENPYDVMWCKHQNVLVYKSCTTVKAFWGSNIILYMELCINKLYWLIICPWNHNLCENE